MKEKKPDYTVQVWLNQDPAYVAWTVKVTSTRYKDSKELSGKSLNVLMKDAAEWIRDN